ncbi:MAG: YezD family protein [Pelosinus sp.]|nr:YezD family protein [Pelosinus sp.]
MTTNNNSAALSKESKAIRASILESLQEMKYGQVTIVIKAGKITQIEKTEKQRVGSLQGLYGDGI